MHSLFHFAQSYFLYNSFSIKEVKDAVNLETKKFNLSTVDNHDKSIVRIDTCIFFTFEKPGQWPTFYVSGL